MQLKLILLIDILIQGSSPFCVDFRCPPGGYCVESVPGRPSCQCPTCGGEWDPVCGSDGITYTNPCRLRLEACSKNKSLSIISKGLCSKFFACRVFAVLFSAIVFNRAIFYRSHADLIDFGIRHATGIIPRKCNALYLSLPVLCFTVEFGIEFVAYWVSLSFFQSLSLPTHVLTSVKVWPISLFFLLQNRWLWQEKVRLLRDLWNWRSGPG